MGIIHGIFFIGGQAFCNPNTILPIFLNHFTNSKTLIGLSSTLMGSLGGIGSVFPQLFVASKLENKIYKKPLLKFAITIRALSWGFLALTTYVFSNTYPSLTIFFLFFILILFTFMGGIAAVPFYDIWGKSLHIPIGDYLVNSIREAIEKLGAKVEIKITMMNQEEQKRFLAVEQENWKRGM